MADFTPPPADLAIRYGMYRAQRIDAEPAGVGILLTGLFDNGAKLTIPVVALLALLASGVDDTAVWEFTAIGIAAVVGGTVVVVWALRSEEFTRRFGEWLGRFISWFLVKFHRNPLEDLGPKSVGIRDQVGATLRSRWPIAVAATIAGHVMGYLIMLAPLRFVGVELREVDWVSLLVAYALVLILTMLPLTPGGIGVAAVGYTAILAGGDPEFANLIAAASLLAKLFTWLLPMIISFGPLVMWQRRQAKEKADGAAAAAAQG